VICISVTSIGRFLDATFLKISPGLGHPHLRLAFAMEVSMSAGTAVAPVQPNPANQALIEQKLKLQSRMRGGAGWLIAVALFSIVNSALIFFNCQAAFHRRSGRHSNRRRRR
jgi:hypothetical protein